MYRNANIRQYPSITLNDKTLHWNQKKAGDLRKLQPIGLKRGDVSDYEL